ncbi:MAG: long-chain fatty acid transporter [Alistipes sp.]|nr:long-chain fatty acid transporter [Alistipes sp.]
MGKKVIAVILAAAALCGATAQQRWDTGGMVIDPNGVTAMDIFNYSSVSHNFGTARSMAMGGALTSLGGDMSSMAINPAGMGMYRTNDIVLTPMIGVAKSSTSDTSPFGKNSSTRFSIANFGVVLKAYEGTGKVVAVNVGFGYNRMADFNYRTSFSRADNASSIAGVFARQLQNSGMTSNDFYDSQDRFDWWRIDPTYWGAALGYKCGLVDDKSGTAPWAPDMFGNAPSVGQYASFESKGSIGEYALSAGMNIDNKVYIGLTLGIQNLYQRRDIYYGEDYAYADGNAPSGREVRWFNYNQTAVVDGTGVNIKFGITYRPIPALRLGVAVHTPTWYALDYKYQGAMMSRVYDNASGTYITPDPDGITEVWRDTGSDSWNFRTPARLLFGASYTFGRFAIISVDYERDWYNGIRTSSTPVGRGVYNEFFRQNFKGSNTVRVGAEVKPLPFMAVRAGYGYNGSMLKDDKTIFSSPVVYDTQYVSAGLGFTLSRYVYIDVAYQYVAQKFTTAKLFYALDNVGENDGTYYDDFSGNFSTKHKRHNIVMTLGFRF